MRRRAFLAGSAAALAPAIAQAQLLPNGQLRQATIGVSVPMSGPLEKYGREVAKGVAAAIDETNRFNAPLTLAFGIRTFDDQNSGAIATANVSIAAADPSIVAMVGNLTADVTLQALPQYANANFALVVPTVTADAITAHGYRNVFRLPTKDSTEGVLFARTVLPRHKTMNVVAVAIEGDYGAEVANGFINQAKSDKHDADAVVVPAKFDAGAVAESLVKRKPDYIFLCGKVDRLGPFAETLRTAGYKGDFGASDGFYTQTTIDKYASTLEGAVVASPFPPLDKAPSIFQLYNDFQHYAGSITAFSAYGYAAAQLIIAAVHRSTTPTRFSLLTTLQQNGTYNTILGQYSFTFTGDATVPNIYLYSVKPDSFAFVKAAVPTGFIV